MCLTKKTQPEKPPPETIAREINSKEAADICSVINNSAITRL